MILDKEQQERSRIHSPQFKEKDLREDICGVVKLDRASDGTEVLEGELQPLLVPPHWIEAVKL